MLRNANTLIPVYIRSSHIANVSLLVAQLLLVVTPAAHHTCVDTYDKSNYIQLLIVRKCRLSSDATGQPSAQRAQQRTLVESDCAGTGLLD